MRHRWLWTAALAAAMLAGCSDDEAAPTQSDADRIRGDWYLEATEGDSDLVSLLTVSWRFSASGEVRQRLGGPFLRELRGLQVVQEALADDEVGVADRIDGGQLSWTGTWALAGDTLRVRFDRVLLEVFGDVPIVGKVTVPVTDEPLSAATEVDYVYRLEDELLLLRGAAVGLGLETDGRGTPVAELVSGPARAIVQAAADLLAAQLEGTDGQRYVRR